MNELGEPFFCLIGRANLKNRIFFSTLAQSSRLFGLLSVLNIDAEGRATLVDSFTGGRSQSSVCLYGSECDNLCAHLQAIIDNQNKTLYRLRWKLRFAFRDSRYDKYKGSGTMPDCKEIDRYCTVHWGKAIDQMTAKELEKYISIIKNWKYAKTDERQKGHPGQTEPE